jgi:5-(carboxyamino)imidazole ribonucleotide synthase
VKNYSDFKPIVYVLGGGQLGLMLHMASQEIGIDTKFLCKSTDPCASYNHILGDITSEIDVYNFVTPKKGIPNSHLTIEVENVNTEALEMLSEDGLDCKPSFSALRIIANKATQKKFIKDLDLPTPKFWKFQSLKNCNLQVSGKILKYQTGGRDGFGVKLLTTKSKFLELPDRPFILEEKVAIAKEFAVIATRDCTGKLVFYPPVLMKFNPRSNQLKSVHYPMKILDSQLEIAKAIVSKIVSSLNIIGSISVEFFLDSSGKVLVNEIAPRLHNSGHIFENISDVSQAKNHLLAVTGGKVLVPNLLAKHALMLNITGFKKADGYSLKLPNIFYRITEMGWNMQLYDYKKSSVTKNRKIGHISIWTEEKKTPLELRQFNSTLRQLGNISRKIIT